MIDYIEQAAKTAFPSENNHLDKIDRTEFIRVFQGFAAASRAAERLKKQAFHGKDVSRIPSIDPAGRNLPISFEDLHANLGVMGEAQEFVDADTREEVLLEGGDLLWYIAKKFKEYGITFDEAMEANIGKLKARYPHLYESNSVVPKIVATVKGALPIKDD